MPTVILNDEPVHYLWKLREGVDFTRRFRIRANINGETEAYDLTGYTIEGEVRAQPDDVSPIETLTCAPVPDQSTNKGVFSVAGSSALFPTSTNSHADLWFTLAGDSDIWVALEFDASVSYPVA